MNCSTPGLPVHHQLPQITYTHVHRVGDASSHLILCRFLLLLPPSPPSIRVFSNESTLNMRWPKYWSFSYNISPHNEHPGLISFRMNWLDLPAVQGTLKSLFQHHSSKASILWHSTFFIHPYMTTRKTTALTRQTFVGKVMSLLFNILSRLVITLASYGTIYIKRFRMWDNSTHHLWICVYEHISVGKINAKYLWGRKERREGTGRSSQVEHQCISLKRLEANSANS